MDRGISLRQLTYFVEAARSGSLLRAAEQLHLSQPALTSALHDLERNLGARLLDRTRTGVELTSYGKVFIHHAINVISEVNAGVSHLEAVLKSERGQVTIGVPPIISFRVIPAALAKFKRVHPYVVVIVHPANLDVLLPSLRLRELDFIVGGVGTPEQMVGITYGVLYQERLCLAAGKGHPLATRKSVSLKDLHDYPWFIPNPYRDFREQVQNLFRDAGMGFPRDFIEAGHNIASGYLRQSQAVAILPNTLLADGLESGALVELRADFDLPSYPIGVMRRDNAELTPTAGLLIEEIRSVAADLHATPRPAGKRKPVRRLKQI